VWIQQQWLLLMEQVVVEAVWMNTPSSASSQQNGGGKVSALYVSTPAMRPVKPGALSAKHTTLLLVVLKDGTL
jgi:hypothetical protein